jgi:hypothetical protein
MQIRAAVLEEFGAPLRVPDVASRSRMPRGARAAEACSVDLYTIGADCRVRPGAGHEGAG